MMAAKKATKNATPKISARPNTDIANRGAAEKTPTDKFARGKSQATVNLAVLPSDGSAEEADAEEDLGGSIKKTPATKIVEMASDLEYFQTSGKETYAVVGIDQHFEEYGLW